ncbi:MAG: PHP domain-containing protein [Chloroflexota bacterium]|nr:PHP domain-containing protein [Chloroflexota bacterium]
MYKRIDLHLHTTASDGRITPEELVQIAAEQGIGVIAITDHDTVGGIEPALCAVDCFPYVTVIPGIEINTDIHGGEVHILGYFIDYKNERLLRTLSNLRNDREIRAQKMVDKLGKLGIFIEWERVMEISDGGSIGRPHIAQAMFEGKHVSSLQDAFERYIGRNGPAYAERERLSPREAVRLIAEADGLPVLAHPATIQDIDKTIIDLKQEGLIGIEVYYDNYNQTTIERLKMLADRYDLIATGGSDFHGFEDKHETPLGEANVPWECAERLIAMSRQRV